VAALTAQSRVEAGTTPAPITPTASDTIARSQAGPNGWTMRIITTGTVSNIVVVDPLKNALGHQGTGVTIAMPATGIREIPIPLLAIDPATDNVTVTSSSQTGLTYELYRA
jgi:hypothetical protein